MKFKVGDRVRGNKKWKEEHHCEIEGTIEMITKEPLYHGEPCYWSLWNRDTIAGERATFLTEEWLELIEPRYKRNLPDWF